MTVEVTSHFNKDISKLRDKKLLLALRTALQQIESAGSLADIPHLKKIEGSSKHFRVRIGDYRLGIFVDGNTITIARFLNRKEIYRYFP